MAMMELGSSTVGDLAGPSRGGLRKSPSTHSFNATGPPRRGLKAVVELQALENPPLQQRSVDDSTVFHADRRLTLQEAAAHDRDVVLAVRQIVSAGVGLGVGAVRSLELPRELRRSICETKLIRDALQEDWRAEVDELTALHERSLRDAATAHKAALEQALATAAAEHDEGVRMIRTWLKADVAAKLEQEQLAIAAESTARAAADAARARAEAEAEAAREEAATAREEAATAREEAAAAREEAAAAREEAAAAREEAKSRGEEHALEATQLRALVEQLRGEGHGLHEASSRLSADHDAAAKRATDAEKKERDAWAEARAAREQAAVAQRVTTGLEAAVRALTVEVTTVEVQLETMEQIQARANEERDAALDAANSMVAQAIAREKEARSAQQRAAVRNAEELDRGNRAAAAALEQQQAAEQARAAALERVAQLEAELEVLRVRYGHRTDPNG